MRAWARARGPCRCGFCGTPIPVGQRYLGFSRPEGHRTLIRCEGCAGETPPEVPVYVPEPAPAVTGTRMVKLSSVKLPADFKVAQAGDREG